MGAGFLNFIIDCEYYQPRFRQYTPVVSRLMALKSLIEQPLTARKILPVLSVTFSSQMACELSKRVRLATIAVKQQNVKTVNVHTDTCKLQHFKDFEVDLVQT
jgi:hypothetical protein